MHIPQKRVSNLEVRVMSVINEGKISVYEAICITTFLITTKIYFTSISVLVRMAGTAAWYTTWVSCAVSIVFFLIIYQLMKRFPDKNLIDIFEIVLGKYIGKGISLLSCAYIVYYVGSNLREFLEMIKVYNLPYTPPSIILVMYVSVVCLIAYFGFNGISRISIISILPVMFGFFLILVLASPNYHTDYLKPYLGYGLKNSIGIGILRSSAYEEVLLLALIMNNLHGLKDFKKAGIISLVIAGVMFGIAYICYLMTFEYTVGSENLSGLFQLSKSIYFNRYFQRLESIFLFGWVISSVVAAAISFYMSISIYSKVFNISNYRPLIVPFAFMIYLVSILPNSLSEVMDINLLFIRQYSLFFVYGIPILVLTISLILGKKGENRNAKKS
jgi:spore germination protein KB